MKCTTYFYTRPRSLADGRSAVAIRCWQDGLVEYLILADGLVDERRTHLEAM